MLKVYTTWMIQYFACLVLILSFDASADEWTPADTRRELIFTSVAALDYGLSSDMVQRYDEGYYEKNPLLGRHPSQGDLNTWAVAWPAAHYVVALNLDRGPRLLWQHIAIASHTYFVLNNFRIGLDVDRRSYPLIAASLGALVWNEISIASDGRMLYFSISTSFLSQ